MDHRRAAPLSCPGTSSEGPECPSPRHACCSDILKRDWLPGAGVGRARSVLTLTLPTGDRVVVARIAQADVAGYRVEASAILTEC